MADNVRKIIANSFERHSRSTIVYRIQAFVVCYEMFVPYSKSSSAKKFCAKNGKIGRGFSNQFQSYFKAKYL